MPLNDDPVIFIGWGTLKRLVRVHATTADLGPDFGYLGLALQLWNTLAVEDSPSGLAASLCGYPEDPSPIR